MAIFVTAAAVAFLYIDQIYIAIINKTGKNGILRRKIKKIFVDDLNFLSYNYYFNKWAYRIGDASVVLY